MNLRQIRGSAPQYLVLLLEKPIPAHQLTNSGVLQERLLLDVAHAFLEETGDLPSMRAIAQREGLARSSIYHYFGSREALLNALVHDIFPKWTERVTAAMAAEDEPSRRILAYALANVQLVHEGAHAVGSALAALTPSEALDEQATRMHRMIQEPLIQTLEQLNVQNPDGVSELINALVHASTRSLESGYSLEEVCTNLVAVIEPMADHMQNRARDSTEEASSCSRSSTNNV